MSNAGDQEAILKPCVMLHIFSLVCSRHTRLLMAATRWPWACSRSLVALKGTTACVSSSCPIKISKLGYNRRRQECHNCICHYCCFYEADDAAADDDDHHHHRHRHHHHHSCHCHRHHRCCRHHHRCHHHHCRCCCRRHHHHHYHGSKSINLSITLWINTHMGQCCLHQTDAPAIRCPGDTFHTLWCLFPLPC